MDTRGIACDLVAMCRAGKFAESGEKYWADDVVSIEFGGADPISRGKAAARAKGVWWAGEQFAVRFTLDVTNKQSGQRMSIDEFGLYTLKSGKIAEERFFYSA